MFGRYLLSWGIVVINKILFVFFVMLFSTSVLAVDGPNGGFFQGLFDFIDWVYELSIDFKNTLLNFLMSISSFFFYVWIQLKISTLEFIWGMVLPIISSLNLSDVIDGTLSGLNQDLRHFVSQTRIVEGINMLISAKVTKLILNLIGW